MSTILFSSSKSGRASGRNLHYSQFIRAYNFYAHLISLSSLFIQAMLFEEVAG